MITGLPCTAHISCSSRPQRSRVLTKWSGCCASSICRLILRDSSPLCRWGRWGADDDRGALHFLMPACVIAAARLVREGVSVTLSLPVNTIAAVHNPMPADHHMTAVGGAAALPPIHFLKDYVGVDYHNDGHTHIDALCHVGYDGLLYNAKSVDAVTTEGDSVNSIEVLRNGLVGRGVLLDIPRLRDRPWLEPGEHVFREDLEEAEREQGVTGRRAWRCCPRLRWEQRHGPSTTEGVDFYPRACRDRAGDSPVGLPATRACLVEMRGGGPLGVPCGRCAAAHRRRDRVAAEPDRDLLGGRLNDRGSINELQDRHGRRS